MSTTRTYAVETKVGTHFYDAVDEMDARRQHCAVWAQSPFQSMYPIDVHPAVRPMTETAR